MLTIVAVKGFARTFRPWLRQYSRFFDGKTQWQTYERLDPSEANGDWLFTDIERLRNMPHLIRKVDRLLTNIEKNGGKIYNHPHRVLVRYQLYQRLNQPYKAFRSKEDYCSARYPVFLRYEHEHRVRSKLINDPDTLDRELKKVGDCLICEYLDTSDANGVFHKYAAFLINEKVIARHLLFSREWIVKNPSIQTRQTLALEAKYLLSNPHAAEIREIFRLANIDYGRIDYSVHNGNLITWEINTNPHLTLSPSKGSRRRRLMFKYTAAQFNREMLRMARSRKSNTIEVLFWGWVARILL